MNSFFGGLSYGTLSISVIQQDTKFMMNWKVSGRNWSQLKIPCNLVGGYQLEHAVSIISMKVTHIRKETGYTDEVGEKLVTEDRSGQSEPGTKRTRCGMS
jgi:hypothetical protein